MQHEPGFVVPSIHAPVHGGPPLGARPFHIRVEETVLDDLRRRIDRTRWIDVEGAGWERGTGRAFLRDLLTYWRDHYEWREHEARLNALPQLTARVGETEIHLVYGAGASPHSVPLLLLHGWPDSFYRYHRVIPKLADHFDLVVPSLPGFGFTRGPTPGPLRRTAGLLYRLMTEVLGHERFAVAGGDTGSALAQILAIDHPESIVGIHVTDLGWHATNVDPSSLTRPERKYVEAAKRAFMSDGAYAMVQTTRPRSLAPALADSPVGLASWIADRFHAWSSADISRDDLLTNLTLYWVTETIGSSMQTYHAEARSPSLTPRDHVDRPVGVALFPADIGGVPPRSFAERTLHVTRWTEMARGGHFAPLEEPDLYAADVIEFFSGLEVTP